MLEFLGGNVVTVDDDDLTISSRSIRLCAFGDGVQNGDTALHFAAEEGHADCVELLLRRMSKEGVELKDTVRELKRSLSLFRPGRARNQQQQHARASNEISSFFFSRRGKRFDISDSIFARYEAIVLVTCVTTAISRLLLVQFVSARLMMGCRVEGPHCIARQSKVTRIVWSCS